MYQKSYTKSFLDIDAQITLL